MLSGVWRGSIVIAVSVLWLLCGSVGMSHELFDERFRDWEEALSGNNSRVVEDAEHGDVIRF